MKKMEPAGWSWIEKWRTGTLSPDEFVEFQDALKTDPEVRETLRKSMAMDSALREMAEAASLQEAWALAGSEKAIDRHWIKAAALIVAGLFVGCLGTGAVWAFSGSGDGWGSAPISLSVFNGGFESGVSSAEFEYPTSPGRWTGDPSEIVTSGDQGIVAPEGQRMLRFQKTSNEVREGKQQRANRWQIVMLDGVNPDQGPIIATAQAQFNRVTGGPATDTQMRVEIAAFAGSPATTEQQLDSVDFLTRTISRVEIDGDPSSWETVAASILVPPGTKFLLIGLAANENVRNNPPDEIEFDGHYVDAVELTLTQGTLPNSKQKRQLILTQPPS